MDANIAVIGCGRWGRNLVRNFADIGALKVICDADPARLQSFAASYPQLKCEPDLSRVLSDEAVRGVVVATPAATHYRMAKQALEREKDVMVEKPLVLDPAEGEELVGIAQQRGRILMVGHLLYYHPVVQKLNELVHEGSLGKVHYIYSHRLNLGQVRQEENVLWSFAPHDISVLLLLLDQLPDSVSAHGGSYLQQGIPDLTVATLNFAGGVQAHIFVSWLNPYKEQRLVVVGDRGMAVFDDLKSDSKLTVNNYTIQWGGQFPTSSCSGQQPVEVVMSEPLRRECQHFLECMETREAPRSDGRNGLAVLRVLQACHRSLGQQGAAVPVNGEVGSLPMRTH